MMKAIKSNIRERERVRDGKIEGAARGDRKRGRVYFINCREDSSRIFFSADLLVRSPCNVYYDPYARQYNNVIAFLHFLHYYEGFFIIHTFGYI